jgi:hypothetical protein
VWATRATAELVQRPAKEVEVTTKVYFDISAGGQPMGRVTLGVFGNDTPKTAANFVALGAAPCALIPNRDGSHHPRERSLRRESPTPCFPPA